VAEVTAFLARPGVHPTAASAARILGQSLALEPFRLAGGTALAWHLGHRVSEDLDFFTLSPGTLDDAGVRALASGLRSLGTVHGEGDRTVHAVVGGCRVSFFEVEGSWFDPPRRVSEGIVLASEADPDPVTLSAMSWRQAKESMLALASQSVG
jgi:hypothetical protein